MEDRITVSIHGISKDSTQIFYSTGHVQVWRKSSCGKGKSFSEREKSGKM